MRPRRYRKTRWKRAAQELLEKLGAAEETLNAAVCKEREASEELVGLRARIAGHAEQIDKLIAELGAPEARTSAREAKLAAVSDAQTALNAAVRDGAAWHEKAPGDARFAELKSAADATEAACKRAGEELTSLRRLEAGLEGELKSDRADDVAARLAELIDACAVAEARCRDMQEEAAALQLLARELGAVATRTRDRFTKPVIERLAPYLQLMLPQARLVLGEDLAPHALERGPTVEDFARLSGGTQEQLALLVRLAFARLLADTGSAAPLILDDALTNADDDRIMRMFRGSAARGAKPSGAGPHLPRARLREPRRPSHRVAHLGRCPRRRLGQPPQTKTPGALSGPGVDLIEGARPKLS